MVGTAALGEFFVDLSANFASGIATTSCSESVLCVVLSYYFYMLVDHCCPEIKVSAASLQLPPIEIDLAQIDQLAVPSEVRPFFLATYLLHSCLVTFLSSGFLLLSRREHARRKGQLQNY